ncbi:hypothetical protein ACFL40_00950 [candidate division KSB1 bacterium]
MKTKEIQEKLVENMKQWQKVENQSIASTGKIMAETNNRVIRNVMEIIQRDSANHYRIQELIISSLTEKSLDLSAEELVETWDLIENHIKIEKMAIGQAKEALESLKGKKMVIQEYLLNYLLMDEEKHDAMLDTLNKIKGGMYPYGGH